MEPHAIAAICPASVSGAVIAREIADRAGREGGAMPVWPLVPVLVALVVLAPPSRITCDKACLHLTSARNRHEGSDDPAHA
jgi:hypothetical protein